MEGEYDALLIDPCSHVWGTATFKVDTVLMSKLWDIYLVEADAIKYIVGSQISFNLQLLTKDEIATFAKNGGNSLGMRKEDGPLFRKFTHFESVYTFTDE